MQKLELHIAEFDLDGFLKTMVAFIRETLGDGGSIGPFVVVVEPDGRFHRLEDEDTPDLRAILAEPGRGIFVDFHTANIGDPFECVDGVVVDPQNVSDDATLPGTFESYGYLITAGSERVTVEAAYHFSGMCPAPPPSLETTDDCGYLDSRMEAFVRRFVKPGKEVTPG